MGPNPPSHKSSPAADDPAAVIAVYQALLTRWQAHNSLLWQLLGFLIAADVALIVAAKSTRPGSTAHFVLCCVGLGTIGILGPLAARWTETHLRMDRFMLDRFERIFLRKRPQLRLHHSIQQRGRLLKFRSTATGQEQLPLLGARRLTPFGAFGARLDRLLDFAGQPSLLCSALLAAIALISVPTGLYVWEPMQQLRPWITISLGCLYDLFLILLVLFGIASIIAGPASKAAEDAYWQEVEDQVHSGS